MGASSSLLTTGSRSLTAMQSSSRHRLTAADTIERTLVIAATKSGARRIPAGPTVGRVRGWWPLVDLYLHLLRIAVCNDAVLGNMIPKGVKVTELGIKRLITR